jgi:hypothetical protein
MVETVNSKLSNYPIGLNSKLNLGVGLSAEAHWGIGLDLPIIGWVGFNGTVPIGKWDIAKANYKLFDVYWSNSYSDPVTKVMP